MWHTNDDLNMFSYIIIIGKECLNSFFSGCFWIVDYTVIRIHSLNKCYVIYVRNRFECFRFLEFPFDFVLFFLWVLLFFGDKFLLSKWMIDWSIDRSILSIIIVNRLCLQFSCLKTKKINFWPKKRTFLLLLYRLFVVYGRTIIEQNEKKRFRRKETCNYETTKTKNRRHSQWSSSSLEDYISEKKWSSIFFCFCFIVKIFWITWPRRSSSSSSSW